VLSSAHADAVGAALVTDSGSSGWWEWVRKALFFFLQRHWGLWGLLFTGPAPAQAQAQVKRQATAAVVDWLIRAEEAPHNNLQLTINFTFFAPKL